MEKIGVFKGKKLKSENRRTADNQMGTGALGRETGEVLQEISELTTDYRMARILGGKSGNKPF